jgi:hypothetical protein
MKDVEAEAAAEREARLKAAEQGLTLAQQQAKEKVRRFS